MAEAVFAHTVKQHNLKDKFSKIDSAGTASYHVRICKDFSLAIWEFLIDMFDRLEVFLIVVVLQLVRLMA